MNFQAVVAIFCYGEKTFAVFFCKLCVLRKTGAIDNRFYRQLSGCDALKASAKLAAMRNDGLLAQKGKGTATYYVPGKAFTSILNNAQNLQDSAQSLQDSERIKLALLPLRKRLKPEVLDKIILDLCSIRGFDRAEISSLLKRNETYIRALLTRVVKSQKLRMEYPEMPNHPHQTY